MFKIQICNPTVLAREADDRISLEEAIEFVFPLDTEFLILIWNHIFIPLTYKYDVSIMVLDFIEILRFIEDDKVSTLDINWPSNTFACTWRMEKRDADIRIESEWETVIGGTEDLLNNSSENIVPGKVLKAEINKLMFFLRRALEASGLDCERIDQFNLLTTFDLSHND